MRVGVLVALLLGAGAAVSVAQGGSWARAVAIALPGLGAIPLCGFLARTRLGIAGCLVVALVSVTIVHLGLFGPRPGIAMFTCAPFVLVGAAAMGSTAAFLVADGMVLVWAVVTGFAAGGLLSLGSDLPPGPTHTLAELGLTALFLNVIAAGAAWAAQWAEPRLTAELAQARAECDRLRHEVESSQSLVSVGRLVANVAHEVSNPLQATDHFLFVLLDQTPESDPRREHLLVVKRGIDRIREYVAQLSEFYRPASADGVAKADANQVVSDVCGFLERQLANADVKLNRELHPDLPEVAIPGDQLRQVLLNLILNGVEAMPGGGELSISSAPAESDIVIAVQDSGVGIAPELMERVFEPFFTTKSSGGGTGLGLSISRRIARSYGGEIALRSSQGSGTCVTLTLPSTRA